MRPELCFGVGREKTVLAIIYFGTGMFRSFEDMLPEILFSFAFVIAKPAGEHFDRLFVNFFVTFEVLQRFRLVVTQFTSMLTIFRLIVLVFDVSIQLGLPLAPKIAEATFYLFL